MNIFGLFRVTKVNMKLNGLLEVGKVIQRDMQTEPLAPRGRTPFGDMPHEYFSTGQYTCGTGDSFVTAYDPWLHAQGVDIVDMELFAIATVAYQFNVPWSSYKYVTDDANENSGKDWQDKVHHGQELFMDLLNSILA